MPNGSGPVYSSSPDPDRLGASSGSSGLCCPATATRCEVANSFDEVHLVRDLIIQAIRAAGFDESACFGIQLALDEALANAVIHGNSRAENATVTITYDVCGEAVYLSIEDEGSGFNPNIIDDPTREENLEIPAGRGLFLMRAYMTQVQYNERGNCVTMLHERAARDEGHEKSSA